MHPPKFCIILLFTAHRFKCKCFSHLSHCLLYKEKKIKFRSNNFIKTGKQLHITFYLANIKNRIQEMVNKACWQKSVCLVFRRGLQQKVQLYQFVKSDSPKVYGTFKSQRQIGLFQGRICLERLYVIQHVMKKMLIFESKLFLTLQ